MLNYDRAETSPEAMAVAIEKWRVNKLFGAEADTVRAKIEQTYPEFVSGYGTDTTVALLGLQFEELSKIKSAEERGKFLCGMIDWYELMEQETEQV
jgi:hypothetical protein